MYAFGKVMRRLIAEYDTTQAEVSRATGIQKQNISLMCNGKTQYPSIHACKRIATYFGLTLDELWAMVEEAEEESSEKGDADGTQEVAHQGRDSQAQHQAQP